MAKMTFETLNRLLDNCIANEVIYNVDFQDWKTYSAGRTLEAEIKAATNEHYLSLPYEDRPNEGPANTLYWSFGSTSILTFPSKKLIAALADMPAGDPYGAAIQAIVDRWTPVAEKFKTLKPMIVKGRKPSETPRKTEERTLENTGTCACCGNNVKLDAAGKIVAHGFTIRHGFQEGQCPAVGCDPIEVSPEGLLKFGEMLNRMLMSAQSAALTLNARVHTLADDPEKLKATRGQAYQAQRQIKWVGDDLARIQERVVEWKPATLPGDLLAA